MKRYFTTYFGCSYTLVARDPAHALELIRGSDGDFDETRASEGEGPVFTELTPDEAATKKIWDDGMRIPLDQFPLGTIASSEF